jgi:hypothetical protein
MRNRKSGEKNKMRLCSKFITQCFYKTSLRIIKSRLLLLINSSEVERKTSGHSPAPSSPPAATTTHTRHTAHATPTHLSHKHSATAQSQSHNCATITTPAAAAAAAAATAAATSRTS